MSQNYQIGERWAIDCTKTARDCPIAGCRNRGLKDNLWCGRHRDIFLEMARSRTIAKQKAKLKVHQ